MSPFDRAHMTSSIATMGLSRMYTVSEIDGDFSRKSQNFPTLVYFTPLKGFLWNWILALGSKNLNDGATGPTKKFNDIFSRLHGYTINLHQRDRQSRQTDRQTDRHRATAKNALTHSVVR